MNSALLLIEKEKEVENYSSDNSGNRIPADIQAANPVAASGVALDAGKDVAGTETVVGGQMYIISTTGNTAGRWLFSITGALATEANVEWVCAQGRSIIIRIPKGVITLYYLQKDQSGYGYLIPLAE